MKEQVEGESALPGLPDLIIEVGAKERKLAEDLLDKLRELIEQGDLRHLIAASSLEEMLEGATGEDVDLAKNLDVLIWVGVASNGVSVASNEACARQVMDALRYALVVDKEFVVGWTCKALPLAEVKLRTVALWRRKQALDQQN